MHTFAARAHFGEHGHSAHRAEHRVAHRAEHGTKTARWAPHGGNYRHWEHWHFIPPAVNSDNGEALNQKVAAKRHTVFTHPPHDLLPRISKLHEHQWHTNWKNVVFLAQAEGCSAGAQPSAARPSSGGCKAKFNIRVPSKVYDEFVAAVKEAPQTAGANSPPEAPPQGWYKAVAILEDAAAEDSESFNAVVDQPDEQVEIVLDGGNPEKGEKRTASAKTNE